MAVVVFYGCVESAHTYVGDPDVAIVAPAHFDFCLLGQTDDVDSLTHVFVPAQDFESNIGSRRSGNFDGVVVLAVDFDHVRVDGLAEFALEVLPDEGD